MVMPTYIDVRKQKFKLTNLVDLQVDMEEIKEQISLMKQAEIVTISSLVKDN